MGLSRESGAALWRQIFSALEKDIARGTYVQGERLPGELALAERFGVNRHTVRQAMAELARLGHVRVDRGRGTFVERRGIDYPLKARTRFTEIAVAKGREPRREVLQTELAAADKDIATTLDLNVGDAVLIASTRSHVSEAPFAISRHVFPADRLPGIDQLLRDTRSITKSLAHFGETDYRRAWTRITAELPTEEVAAALDRPMSRPVLHTESLNVGKGDRPLEFARTWFAGDLCRLTVDTTDLAREPNAGAASR